MSCLLLDRGPESLTILNRWCGAVKLGGFVVHYEHRDARAVLAVVPDLRVGSSA